MSVCVCFVSDSNKSNECVCVCFVSDSNKSNEHVEMDAEMEAVYDG